KVPVTHPITLGGDAQVVSHCCIQQGLRCELAFVHQHATQVGVVFDDIHAGMDLLKQRCRFINTAQPDQRISAARIGGIVCFSCSQVGLELIAVGKFHLSQQRPSQKGSS